MMAENKTSGWLRPACVMLALSATLLALLALASVRLDGWLAARWSAELHSAPDDDAPRLLRQLAALDEAGLPGLAAGLASSRSVMVQSAQQVLLDSLAEWELLPVGEASPKLYLLAASLADQVGHATPEGRLAAAQICQRILAWQGGYPGVAPGQLAIACERVLASVQDDDASQAADRRVAERTARLAAAHERRVAAAGRLRAAAPAALLASHEQAVATDEGQKVSGPSDEDTEPQELAVDSTVRQIPSDSARPSSDYGATGVNMASTEPGWLPADMSHARPIATHDEEFVPRSGRAASPLEPLPDLASVGTVELVNMLYDDSGQAVSRAEAELAQRGFTGVQLELAKRLTDPDPEVRRRWVQTLPGMKDFDARQWLLWLARDSDAAVRRTAMSLLATSDDPRTLTAVERLAGDDADPGVRQIAAKIAERRAGRKPR